ncbi:hypothetical protein PMAYCL1PPCAC_26807, partial [Pristionchus mayeri]
LRHVHCSQTHPEILFRFDNRANADLPIGSRHIDRVRKRIHVCSLFRYVCKSSTNCGSVCWRGLLGWVLFLQLHLDHSLPLCSPFCLIKCHLPFLDFLLQYANLHIPPSNLLLQSFSCAAEFCYLGLQLHIGPLHNYFTLDHHVVRVTNENS